MIYSLDTQQVTVVHDPDMPQEHPGLDVHIALNEEDPGVPMVSLIQGSDVVLMPLDHAARMVLALQGLPGFPDALIAAMPRPELAS